MPAKEAILIRLPQKTDKFRDPIEPVNPWGPPVMATVVPRSSQEEERRGTVIISGFMIVVPSAVDVPTHGEFLVRGEVYTIEGEVADYGRKKIFNVQRVN